MLCGPRITESLFEFEVIRPPAWEAGALRVLKHDGPGQLFLWQADYNPTRVQLRPDDEDL